MLTPFVATRENVMQILHYVNGWPASVHGMLTPDELAQIILAPSTFVANIIDSKTQFNKGVVMIENIHKGGTNGFVSYVFWNRRPKEHIEDVVQSVGFSFSQLNLSRLTALVPDRNYSIGACLHKAGFRREGALRAYMPDGQGCTVYGVIKEPSNDIIHSDTARSGILVPGYQQDVHGSRTDESGWEHTGSDGQVRRLDSKPSGESGSNGDSAEDSIADDEYNGERHPRMARTPAESERRRLPED